MDAILYLHGKGGSAEEAEHYRPLFPACDVIGFDYRGSSPWEAGEEIRDAVTELKADYDRVILIANSIGAYFAMNAGIEGQISHAYFISPIVDLEKLITDRMEWAGVTESDLAERGIIPTEFGEDLSWDYVRYVREHPVRWNVPTEILCGSGDTLTSPDTLAAFVRTHPAHLTVMNGGEHWFHTEAQMQFLDQWIGSRPDTSGLQDR